MCPAIARIKSGGTLLPIRAHFCMKVPSILNSSGKEDISLISLIVKCRTSYGGPSPLYCSGVKTSEWSGTAFRDRGAPAQNVSWAPGR